VARGATFRLKQLGSAGAAGSSALAHLAEKARLTLSGLGLLAVGAAGWFVAKAASSRTLFLMAYATVAVIAMAWVLARRRLLLDVDRSSLPSRMRAGQDIEVALEIRSRRRVSTILVKERLHDRLGASVQVPVAALSPGESLSHTYRLRPTLRGIYEVGPAIAVWSDPFGFTTHSQEVAPATTVIVHPSTEMVHDRVVTRMWEDPPIRPPISKPWPTGFEFYGMRNYVPGDDLRRVVWNAVAKTGKLLVRESEQGITDRVLICLDTAKEWHSPGDPSATFETGIRVAAAVGVKHLGDGFSVSLVTNQGLVLQSLRGARAPLAYLDEMARLHPDETPFLRATERLVKEARSGAHFVVVTPHLGRESASRLRLLLERGASVVVALLPWEESDPVSMHRAVALGCRVVQVPPTGSLEAVLAHNVGAGTR
jgi:uncharacterized protein (DUF58 family)